MHQPVSQMCPASFRAAISTVLAIVLLISDVSLAFVARGSPILVINSSSNGRSSTTAAAATATAAARVRRPLARVVGIMNSSATSTEQDAAKKEQPSPPAIVKGVLFDMDGTLTDSDTLHFEAYRETFLKASKHYSTYTTGVPAQCTCT